MGKVWRAHHTALKRDDALKVLPDAFATDPNRLARFRREAQVLASLNHPNIAHVYGLEQADGVQALVMELVEGPTLADRIAQGPIPVDEAVAIAKQIAEALEAAHEQGIIHRDLKPANVKQRPDGTVKVLDFGLAKALQPAGSGPEAAANASFSPTITSPAVMSGVGVVLGTAAYMSPEQARGRAVDKRADIWAFGCVLFEMLSARRAFEDEDVSLTLSKVLQREPDYQVLPPDVPARMSNVIRLCLKKPLRERLPDIGTVRLALDGAFETHADAVAGSDRNSARRLWARPIQVAATLVLMLLTGVGTWLVVPRPSLPPPQVIRFAPAFPVGQAPTGMLRFTRDESALVYVGPNESGGAGTQLWMRRWAELQSTPIRGTNGVVSFTLSPDGREVAFAGFPGPLRVIPLRGGSGRTLVDNVYLVSDWADDGTIYVTNASLAIARVASKGSPAAAKSVTTHLDREFAHVFMTVLPGGRMGVFEVIRQTDRSDAEIWAIDFKSGERHMLIAGNNPHYAF